MSRGRGDLRRAQGGPGARSLAQRASRCTSVEARIEIAASGPARIIATRSVEGTSGSSASLTASAETGQAAQRSATASKEPPRVNAATAASTPEAATRWSFTQPSSTTTACEARSFRGNTVSPRRRSATMLRAVTRSKAGSGKPGRRSSRG